MISFLEWANTHGIWDLVQALVLILSAGFGIKLLFFPKSRIRHLNFTTRVATDHQQFPLRLAIEVRNLTGRSVVISNAWFEYHGLQPDPTAHGDTPSGEYEIKFPGPDGQFLSEVDFLLRNKESVTTFVSLDPAHTSESAQAAMTAHKIGRMTCTLTWLDLKPKSHKLRRRL